jgi:hypothetical protein
MIRAQGAFETPPYDMTIQPFPSRYTATDQGGRLVITLPARRDWVTVVFLGIWSLVWLGVEVIVVGGVAAGIAAGPARGDPSIGLGEAAGVSLFALLWFTLWTAGGLFALYTWLWQITGREVIEVSREGIKLSRKVLGRGRAKTYLAEHIQDLRVSPSPFASLATWRQSRQPFAMLGTLAFDYGARTIRFADTDEAEAKMILKEIQKRYSRYRAE